MDVPLTAMFTDVGELAVSVARALVRALRHGADVRCLLACKDDGELMLHVLTLAAQELAVLLQSEKGRD